MKCEDIDDKIFLLIVKRLGMQWSADNNASSCWAFLWDVGDELKKEYPEMPMGSEGHVKKKYRFVLAKAQQLINRDLMDGCTCGCRGDFELTEKGEKLVQESRLQIDNILA